MRKKNVIEMEKQIEEFDEEEIMEEKKMKKFNLKKIGLGSYRDWETDRKSTRLNSSHSAKSRMPSSA